MRSLIARLFHPDLAERVEEAVKFEAKMAAECDVHRTMFEWHLSQMDALDPKASATDAFAFAQHYKKHDEHVEDHRYWSIRRAAAAKKVEALQEAFKR